MPRKLEWKGSHTGIAINPDGDRVVTAMQENALHGWRLTDGGHMRMTGYPGKTRAVSFTHNGRWLATSGADAIVLWPFFGGGPIGKTPTELAGGDGVICTMVAANPQHDVVAAGFADGLVVLAEINATRCCRSAAPAGDRSRHSPGARMAPTWRSAPRPASPRWWISRSNRSGGEKMTSITAGGMRMAKHGWSIRPASRPPGTRPPETTWRRAFPGRTD